MDRRQTTDNPSGPPHSHRQKLFVGDKKENGIVYKVKMERF